MLAHGIALGQVQIDQAKTPPDWRAYDGIVAMAGR